MTHSLRGHWVWKKATIEETSLTSSFLHFWTPALRGTGTTGCQTLIVSVVPYAFFTLLRKELTGMDRRQLLLPSAPRRMDVLAEVLILWVGRGVRRGIPPLTDILLLNIHYEIYFHCVPFLWVISMICRRFHFLGRKSNPGENSPEYRVRELVLCPRSSGTQGNLLKAHGVTDPLSLKGGQEHFD